MGPEIAPQLGPQIRSKSLPAFAGWTGLALGPDSEATWEKNMSEGPIFSHMQKKTKRDVFGGHAGMIFWMMYHDINMYSWKAYIYISIWGGGR